MILKSGLKLKFPVEPHCKELWPCGPQKNKQILCLRATFFTTHYGIFAHPYGRWGPHAARKMLV